MQIEIESNNTAIDDWKNSAEGLSKKVEALTDDTKTQEKVVDKLEQNYKSMSTSLGENSKETAEARTEYENARKKLDGLNNELKDSKTALSKAESAMNKTGNEARNGRGDEGRRESS